MTFRVNLPDNQWADMKATGELTGADQDAIFDAYDEIMDAKPQPEPQPDPSNPAVMLPAADRKLTNADSRALRDKILGLVITAWSFGDLPLPYVPAHKARLPLPACNALRTAVKPMETALFDIEAEDPKSPAPSPGSDGSTGTSPASTESPLPAPPAALPAMP